VEGLRDSGGYFVTGVSICATQSQRPSCFEYTFKNLRGVFDTVPLYSTPDVLIPVTMPVFPWTVT
jgi:hypothetical protein